MGGFSRSFFRSEALSALPHFSNSASYRWLPFVTCIIQVRETYLTAPDLAVQLVGRCFTSYLCLSTIQHRISGLSCLSLDLLRLFLLHRACHCSSGPPPVGYYTLKSVCITEEKQGGNLNLNPQANSLANRYKNPLTHSRSTRFVQIHRTHSDPQDSSRSTDSFKIHRLLRIHRPGSPAISRRSQSSTDDLHLDLPPPDLSRSVQLQTITRQTHSQCSNYFDCSPQLTLVVGQIWLCRSQNFLLSRAFFNLLRKGLGRSIPAQPPLATNINSTICVDSYYIQAPWTAFYRIKWAWVSLAIYSWLVQFAIEIASDLHVKDHTVSGWLVLDDVKSYNTK